MCKELHCLTFEAQGIRAGTSENWLPASGWRCSRAEGTLEMGQSSGLAKKLEPHRAEVEAARVAELDRYRILDSEPEEDFDRIVALTSRVFDAPLACVSLVSDNRIWFKSTFGFEAEQISRDGAFCAQTVDSQSSLVVLNTLNDPTFVENPLVTGDMGVRFYAGAPLVTPAGHALGTLCILDTIERDVFTEAQLQSLLDLTSMIMDRIELRYAKLAKKDSEQRFHRVAVSLGEGIVCTDGVGRVTFWNPGAEAIFGHKAKDVLGQSLDNYLAPDSSIFAAGSGTKISRKALQSPGGYLTELEGAREGNQRFTLEACFSGWPDGQDFHYTIIMRDISKRKSEEEKIRFLAEHDTLTGLANRAYFREVVEGRLSESELSRAGIDLLLIDLNNFKDINDTQGHACGDHVLCAIAERIKSCAPSAILTARLSGDEFAVVVENSKDGPGVNAIADRIANALRSKPIVVGDQQLFVEGSVGVAGAPQNGKTVDELYANADLALYKAKELKRSGHVVYRPEIRQALENRKKLEKELREAVVNEEFELYYQPQIRMSDGAVVGAEALIRWNHPERGVLPPSEFLPVLNDGIYSDDVGLWVLESACRQARTWEEDGSALRVGVNLSPSHFRTDDLADTVEKVLTETTLTPSLLELEVTENILLEDDERTVSILSRIREIGVSLAFDDFGTGYASLSHLKRFPLDRIKIDRSFVRDIAIDPEDASIVRAIIGLGRLLGLSVIAEGIEDSEQLTFLAKQRCQEAQGFLFGRPMASENFHHFLSTHNAEPLVDNSKHKYVA